MCGILFYLSGRPDAFPGAERFENALNIMNPRGPDGRGLQYGDNYAVGHTRLAIIDLSPRAAQPFWDRSRRHVLTYNGELYKLPRAQEEADGRRGAFRIGVGHRSCALFDAPLWS